MLSDDLSALASQLSEYEHTGVQLSAAMVSVWCAELASASLQAAELERHTVPAAARVVEGRDNVLRLDPVRARRNGPAGGHPSGNAA